MGADDDHHHGHGAKFTRARLDADLRAAGLQLRQFYTDADELFALSLVGP